MIPTHFSAHDKITVVQPERCDETSVKDWSSLWRSCFVL